mgnify:CR=1 FL=1
MTSAAESCAIHLTSPFTRPLTAGQQADLRHVQASPSSVAADQTGMLCYSCWFSLQVFKYALFCTCGWLLD